MAEGSDWDYPSGSDVITIGDEHDDRDLLPPMGPALGASYTRASGRHVDPIRLLIWTLTGLLLLCVAALMLAGWSRTAHQSQSTAATTASYPLNIVFGDQSASGGGVCTDETLQSGTWNCTGWATGTAGLPTEQALPQEGSCTERRVDESAGRWVCVQS